MWSILRLHPTLVFSSPVWSNSCSSDTEKLCSNVIKCRQNTCRGVSSPAVMASTVLRETKAQTRHGGSSRVWRYRSTIFTIVYSDDLSQTAGTALHHTANSLPVMKRGRGLAKVLRHTRERRGSHSPVVISRHWEHCCSVFCGILLTFRHQTSVLSE